MKKCYYRDIPQCEQWLFSTSDMKYQMKYHEISDEISDVLLLSKVRKSASLASCPHWLSLSLQPIRNQYCERGRVAREAVCERGRFSMKNGLSHTQPLPLNHVICLSQSESMASLTHGLSCTDRPLLHRSASLAQIGLSCTDRPLLHRSASLAQIGLSCTDRPLLHRSASLAQIGLSCTDRPLLHRSASLAQIGLSCTDQPLLHRSASLAQIGLSRTDQPLLHRSASPTKSCGLCLSGRGRSVRERPICAREADL